MNDERRNGHRREEDRMIEARLGSLEEGQDRLFDVLMGPNILQMDGTYQRQTEEGLEYKAHEAFKMLTNGGVKIRLPRTAWAAIILVILEGVFQVWASLG